MESYPAAPHTPPAAPDPVRKAAYDGYITLITTLLPAIRSGREARPGEIRAAWAHLRSAVEATGSDTAAQLLAGLPQQPAAGDLAPLTAELGRLANVRSHQP